MWDVIALTVYVGLASKLSVLFRLASAWGGVRRGPAHSRNCSPDVPSHPVWLEPSRRSTVGVHHQALETTQKQLDDSIAQEGRRQVDDIASGRAIEIRMSSSIGCSSITESGSRDGSAERPARSRHGAWNDREREPRTQVRVCCRSISGWADFEMATRQVADDPMSILPTWPAVPDRRQRLDRRSPMVPHSPERRVEVSYRRKTDSPEILRYLRGSPESPQKAVLNPRGRLATIRISQFARYPLPPKAEAR